MGLDSDEDRDLEEIPSNVEGEEESACTEGDVDKGEEQQDVFKPTFESPTLNTEASLPPMSEDVGMMGAPASVSNELNSNITERMNNSMSLCWC